MAIIDIPQIEIGDAVPPFEILLTLQKLVMEAGANRDFTPIHYDREFARASGAPDAYINTPFIQSIMEVTLRRWMGLAGKLRMLQFRMLTFNCIGDTLVCSGKVTSIRLADRIKAIELSIWIESQRGRTVDGTAAVELPIQD